MEESNSLSHSLSSSISPSLTIPPFSSSSINSIYISRIPLQWTENHLKDHFESCFGEISSCTIQRDDQNENKSLGYGFLSFITLESKEMALKQGSLHVKRKVIQIRDYLTDEEREREKKSNNNLNERKGICYLWKKFQCVHGDNCKFLHEGEGNCIKVSPPGEGKKKCLSFKSKGKCSKGDQCPFLHILRSTNGPTNAPTPPTATIRKTSGVCNSFLKKGKCRQGDSCKYAHTIVTQTVETPLVDESNKRKRIDGSLLVEKRKRLMVEQSNEIS